MSKETFKDWFNNEVGVLEKDKNMETKHENKN